MAATSNDYPGLPFIQARGYTVGRRDGPPLWVVWHTMEAGEHSARARNTAGYFAAPGDGRDVSAHWCVDDTEVIQCVDLDDTAWTVGNRPGNNRGLNVELSGFARQTAAQWLDPFGVAMFAKIAPVVAAAMKRWSIPNAWRAVADLRNMRPGHTTHHDLGRAFGGTDHTDPGPHFPRSHVLTVVGQALAGETDIMTVEHFGPDAVAEFMRRDGAVDTPWDKGNETKSLAESVRYLLEVGREDRKWRTLTDAVLREQAAKLGVVAVQMDALAGLVKTLCDLIAAGGGSAEVAALTARVDRLAAAVTSGGQTLASAGADPPVPGSGDAL